ncbi:MAG: Gfo/Idh/MocA family oxidoreductase [Candidatus Solibacter sp.]
MLSSEEKQGAGSKVSRRSLLTAGAAAAFTILPSRVLGFGGAVPPSEKLNVAFVGIGTRGSFDLKEISNLQHNIVALCDVDWRPLTGREYPTAIEIVENYPKAKRYDDWRIMLQEQDKNIDAVVVATANHTHAIVSIAAMKMGKHVYCEKPLAHSVEEIRAMIAAEKKYKVTTQTGCQGHSSEDCRNIVEWVKDGAIGDVSEVHIFQNLKGGKRFDYAEVPKIVTETHDVPDEVKWDLWLGPAPARKFNPQYVPGTWRSWRDFGDGIIGDYCCHSFDPVFWALDLNLPEKIESRPDQPFNPSAQNQVWPNAGVVRWDFPARGKMPPVAVIWHYGLESGHIPLPNGWKAKDILPPAGGGIFFGTKGAIVFGPIYASLPLAASTGDYKPVTWGTPTKVRMFPEELEKSYKVKNKLNFARPFNHWSDFCEAAKAGKPAGAPFSYGGLLSETSALGNIGFTQPGRILNYDAKAGQFINNDEANKLLKVSYRKGFELPV